MRKKWTQAVQEELQRLKKHDVFEVVKLKDVPPGVKILTTTWAMKLKSNGTYLVVYSHFMESGCDTFPTC